MALIARVFVVLFAFVLACVAGAAVMAFALLPGWNEVLDRPDQQSIAIVVGLAAAFFSIYAMVPAMLMIALAEGFRLRSIFFYALVGAALALCSAYGWDLRFLNGPDDLGWRGPEIMAAVGIVGGVVYWALAGRNAGAWRTPSAFHPRQSSVNPPS